MESLYTQLNMDQVNVTVAVGVEKQFASAIPPETKALLEERARMNAAINRRTRDLNVARARLQAAQRRAGKIIINKLHDLIKSLASGDEFGEHIRADRPFAVSHVAPLRQLSVIPETIDVGVVTDLSLERPAVEGGLAYHKRDFQRKLEQRFKALEG